MLPVLVWISVICYCLSTDDLSHGIYAPLSLFLTHRMMVALKYACMSKEEYERMLPTRELLDGELPLLEAYRTQAQIISGLLNNNKELIEFQVASSASCVGLNLTKLYFEVPLSVEKDSGVSSIVMWKSFLADGLGAIYGSDDAGVVVETGLDVQNAVEIAECSPDKDVPVEAMDHIKIPLYLVAVALVGRASKSYLSVSWSFFYVLMVMLMLVTVQPFLVLEYSPVTLNAVNIAYFTSTTLVMLLFGPLLMMFLTGCFFVALRKRSLAQKLKHMTRPPSERFSEGLNLVRSVFDSHKGNADFCFCNEYQKEHSRLDFGLTKSVNTDTDVLDAVVMDFGSVSTEGVEAVVPRLAMNDNNSLVFLALHQMMLVFGDRFQARLNIFVAVIFQITLVLMLVTVVVLLISPEPSSFLDTALFRQITVAIAMFAMAAIVIVYIGGFTNKLYDTHRYFMWADVCVLVVC